MQAITTTDPKHVQWWSDPRFKSIFLDRSTTGHDWSHSFPTVICSHGN